MYGNGDEDGSSLCVDGWGIGDRVQRGRLGMDSKFAGTDGDVDELSSPA